MATVDHARVSETADLQELAKRHLWMLLRVG